MKSYILILSSIIIISCSRPAGTGNVIYDNATITQFSNKSDLKEQKSHNKAAQRKRQELAAYETHSGSKKTKKH
jgi:hypothetical protein